MKTSPLAGMRVVEMGSSVAGPYAGWMFAQLGAEVLKVEDPRSGDATRAWGPPNANGHSAIFETLNNGKKSITVDLSDPVESQALANLIVETADIVLQNLRPGFAERCGVGQIALTSRQPALIYCDLGAYGKNGPLQDLPGYDPLMQGFTGIAQGTGTEHSPSRVVSPVTDFLTGMWSVVGALSMLQTRQLTGEGGRVDVSLMESGMALMTMFVGLYQSTGMRPERQGLRGNLVAPNGGYETADGPVMIVCGTDHLFRKLCAAIGNPDLADDPRFVDSSTRFSNNDALTSELESILKTQTRVVWMDQIGKADVPIAPVNHVDEMMSHPQAQAVGIMQTLANADNSPASTSDAFKTVRLPVRFDGERAGYTARGPELGEHTAEYFSEFVARVKSDL